MLRFLPGQHLPQYHMAQLALYSFCTTANQLLWHVKYVPDKAHVVIALSPLAAA